MNFTELGKEIIKRGAPLLGLAFGAPGAAVGTLVANVFGADANSPTDIAQKIRQDPDAKIKLLELQSAYKLQLEQLALQAQVEENKDRSSARLRETELAKAGMRDRTPGILALLFTLGYLAMLLFFSINAEHESDTMVMGLTNAEMLVLSYYFGSSNRKLRDDL